MRKAHLLRWRFRPFLRRIRYTPQSDLNRRLASGPFSFACPTHIGLMVRKDGTTMRVSASLPLVVLMLLVLGAGPVLAGPFGMWGGPRGRGGGGGHGVAGPGRV